MKETCDKSFSLDWEWAVEKAAGVFLMFNTKPCVPGACSCHWYISE